LSAYEIYLIGRDIIDKMAIERCDYIDFLKSIGLLLIILAHVNPPFIITQVRCFDVPLMMFASGLAFSGKGIKGYGDFIKPRTKRLVIPVYIFLFFFFLINYFLDTINFDRTQVLCSFLLLNTKSIGYVWVIRVFLLLMLLTPLWVKLNNQLNWWKWIGVILLLFLIDEFVLFLLSYLKSNKLLYYFIYETVPFAISYSIPFLFGLRLKNVKQSIEGELLLIYALFFVSFFMYFIIINGPFENLSPKFKYPPRAIFVMYGVMISLLLWYCRRYLNIIASLSFVTFYGRHTIWIYLWHIPVVMLVERMNNSWCVDYIIVFVVSFLLFFIQYNLVIFVEKYCDISIFKYLKK